MDLTSNLILIVIFGALGIWMWLGVYKTKDLVIKDKRWNSSRILFAVSGALLIVTAFVYSSALDWLRLFAMAMCICSFLVLRDGIGETGVASMGKMTTWDQVKFYDYKVNKKKFEVYFICKDLRAKKSEEYNVIVAFDLKDQQAVIDFLKKHIGKKYARMRKG